MREYILKRSHINVAVVINVYLWQVNFASQVLTHDFETPADELNEGFSNNFWHTNQVYSICSQSVSSSLTSNTDLQRTNDFKNVPPNSIVVNLSITRRDYYQYK